eukprot:3014084-Prymnesium_polylepis.1
MAGAAGKKHVSLYARCTSRNDANTHETGDATEMLHCCVGPWSSPAFNSAPIAGCGRWCGGLRTLRDGWGCWGRLGTAGDAWGRW